MHESLLFQSTNTLSIKPVMQSRCNRDDLQEVDVRRSTLSISVSEPSTKDDAVKSNEARSSQYVLMMIVFRMMLWYEAKRETNIPSV